MSTQINVLNYSRMFIYNDYLHININFKFTYIILTVNIDLLIIVETFSSRLVFVFFLFVANNRLLLSSVLAKRMYKL